MGGHGKTSYTPSRALCVALRSCAVAILCSSCASSSSLRSASPISDLPPTFFKNFSKKNAQLDQDRHSSKINSRRSPC